MVENECILYKEEFVIVRTWKTIFSKVVPLGRKFLFLNLSSGTSNFLTLFWSLKFPGCEQFLYHKKIWRTRPPNNISGISKQVTWTFETSDRVKFTTPFKKFCVENTTFDCLMKTRQQTFIDTD